MGSAAKGVPMDLTELRDTRTDLRRWGEQWLVVADFVGMAVGALVAFAALYVLLG
jgi:hypothetical protein